jgi:dTDP-glucose pyrophosphorylase
MGKRSNFFKNDEYIFPEQLMEINDKTIIEMVIDNYNKIKEEKRFIFIVNKEECYKYHMDNVLNLITDKKCEIIKLDKLPKGAACSCLLAIDSINNEDELVIANADQIFDIELSEPIDFFRNDKTDSGVICFESIHPRWSFVLCDENNKIIETSEKKPISKNAIAGFYYFKHGKDFVAATMKSIERDANVNGNFYIAPIINEFVLENKNLNIYKIDNSKYDTLYSPEKVEQYKNKLSLLRR